jgi:hypothetical protein
MRSILLAVLAVAACGGDGPTHWKDQPLETFEGTNDGVTFTIQLPKGMKKSSVESKYDVEYSYHQDVGGEGRVFAPNVSISKASKKKTLEEGMKDESDIKSPTDVVFKEETADGWTFAIENSSYKGREDYLVRAQKTVGDITFRCSARVFPMKKGGKTKDDIPAIAKMCQSVKPK